jgi:hypothetical protein
VMDLWRMSEAIPFQHHLERARALSTPPIGYKVGLEHARLVVPTKDDQGTGNEFTAMRQSELGRVVIDVGGTSQSPALAHSDILGERAAHSL